MALKLMFTARCVALSSLFVLALPMWPAYGQTKTGYQNEIQRYQERASKIKATEIPEYQAEFTQLTSWLNEAHIYLERNDTKHLRGLLLKASVYLDFIEAGIEGDRAAAEARDAEARLRTLKADYGKVSARVEQLKAEEASLQQRLEALKQ